MDKQQLLIDLQDKCIEATQNLIKEFNDKFILHQENIDTTFFFDIQSDFDCPTLMNKYSKICSISYTCDFWQQIFDEILTLIINKVGLQINRLIDDIPLYIGIPHTQKLAMFGKEFLKLLSQKFDQYLENRELHPYDDNSYQMIE